MPVHQKSRHWPNRNLLTINNHLSNVINESCITIIACIIGPVFGDDLTDSYSHLWLSDIVLLLAHGMTVPRMHGVMTNKQMFALTDLMWWYTIGGEGGISVAAISKSVAGCYICGI